MNSTLIAHKNHDIYFNLAQENLINAEKVYQEILESNKVIPFGEIYLHTNAEAEASSWLNSKLLKIKKFVVASIIFSALTAEAFINFYAILKGMPYEQLEKNFRASKNYQVDELSPEEIQRQYQFPCEERTTVKEWVAVKDKSRGVNISSAVVKWIEIPRLFTGKYIASGLDGSRIYELNQLFKLRNNLVHHKATIFNLDIEDFDLKYAEDKNYITMRQAQLAVELVIKVAQSLQRIDGSVDLDWLIYSE